jgi:outer membrane protein assembly factor BamB
MAGIRWTFAAAGVAVVGVAFAADWPQWRGPSRDNKVPDFKIPATWPEKLTQKWKADVGNGVSCPVLVGDKVYTYTRRGGDEVITCLDAATGKEIWSDKFPAKAPNPPAQGYPGPRATPAIGEGMVVTFGVEGTITCYDAATGKQAWRNETKAAPRFATSSSPLIADGLVVVFVGSDGKGELTGFDLKTGESKWKWTGEGAKYGSPVLATIGGVKQVVTLAERSLVGVALADGKLLWKHPYSTQYNAATPVVDGDTVYVSIGQAGTTAVKVTKDGDKFEAKQLWNKRLASANYNTPMLKDGFLYGLTNTAPSTADSPPPPPAGGGRQRGGGGRGGPTYLYCMDAKTGDVKWTDDKPRGECGGVFDAGSVLLLLSSDSTLVAFKPDPTGFKEVANYPKLAVGKTYALPILTGNRVFVKDMEQSLILWQVE